jgi:hypothetical protein
MTKKQIIQILIKSNACKESIAWVRKTPGSPKVLWGKCRNGSWLHFLITVSQVEFDWTEYDRRIAPVREKYDRQDDILRAEYRKAEAEYISFASQISNLDPEGTTQFAKLSSKLARARREYKTKTESAWSRLYRRPSAAIYHSLVSWDEVEKALAFRWKTVYKDQS